ncbi:ABC-2 family transporter protein, partial [Lactobacillus helveticus]
FLLPFGLVATPATVVLLQSSYKLLLLQLLVTIIFINLDMLFWKLGVRKYDGAGR